MIKKKHLPLHILYCYNCEIKEKSSLRDFHTVIRLQSFKSSFEAMAAKTYLFKDNREEKEK